MLNPNASAFACANSNHANPLEDTRERLNKCNIGEKDKKKLATLMNEWYTSPTLNYALTRWEAHSKVKENEAIPESAPMIFVLYNVQGLGSRSPEVIELVSRLQASFIICTEVGEIWNKHPIPDFNLFYEAGTNKNGGVAIGVGKHLKATKVDTNMANTVVVDILGLNEPLRVIGIYWPASQKRDIEEINKFITKNTIVAGDFNASVKQWNSPNTDKRGEILEKLISNNHLEYIEGTKNSSKRSNRNIDLTFVNLPGITGETLEFGTSDHWPLVYKSEFVLFETSKQFEVVNWFHFEIALCLLQEFWKKQIEVMNSIDWYRHYTRFIAALKMRLTESRNIEKWRPALPQQILRKLKQVRKIKNRFQKKRREEDRLLLRQGTREVRKEIYEYRANRWNSFLDNVQNKYGQDTSAFWKFMSRIYRPPPLPFNKLLVNNKELHTSTEIVNELAQYYERLFSPPCKNPPDQHTAQIEQEFEEIQTLLKMNQKEIKPTNFVEIKGIIKKLKPKKSAGIDRISNFMLKKLPPGYIECLCKCFNDWLKESYLPEEWKTARIVTLNKLKAGTPTCEQTRPISLLATHSKIYEKILLNRIQEWEGRNNIVPDEQSGFRKGCQLQTRVLSMYQEVNNQLDGNVPVLALYVDYKKAYDLVWHKGLIVKLNRMGLPMELTRILITWLTNRSVYISFGNAKSATFYTQVGLPQGSTLSPFIFIVYHADLVKTTNAFSTHLFADDLCTLIVPPIDKQYKKMIEFIEKEGTKISQNLYDYANKWQQPINVTKTVFQVFHTQVNEKEITIRMDNERLEKVKIFKYLGFTWSDRLSLKPTVDHCIQQIQKSYSKLKYLKRNNSISTEVLRTCFFAYSFPFFTRIFPFFPLLPKTQQELFLRKFRVGLRLIHRCPFVEAHDIIDFTKEKPLEAYISSYLRKRVSNAHRTDLGRSYFYEDIFHWNSFVNFRMKCKKKRKPLGVGHLYQLARVKQMLEKHESFLTTWLEFIDAHEEKKNEYLSKGKKNRKEEKKERKQKRDRASPPQKKKNILTR